MKIYHTETQEDYNALMIDLESEGITWHNGQSLTKDSTHIWNAVGNRTCIRVTESIAFRALKSFYEKRFSSIPIIKYKAKVINKMKIYHTKTQEDYDALMVELERQGCKWLSGHKPTSWNDWSLFREDTCIRLDDDTITQSFKSFYDGRTPITKYKAKVEEKMKFTKENVKKVVDEYFRQADFESCGDLIAEIHNLDDTPKKVAVPKFVADVFSSELHFEYEIQESRNIPHVLSAAFSEVSSNKNIKFLQWVKQYPDKYVMAVKFGYEAEKEPLYYIPLPQLETSDGIQQVLSKRDTYYGDTYFASCPNEKLKQRFTKDELARVPEIYKSYANPVEGE